MKKQFPTAIDISAESVSSIIVSGGKVGLQMEMGLADLQRVTGADIVDLTSEKVKGEDSLR